MALNAGTRLGSYEILGAIGAGGMGEVYRARDMRLGREVAIKILPDQFAADADRVARFQREAQVLASLNHPNIAHIHGLEDAGTSKALVLELVDGPTLADLIAKGAIPLDEALPIAKQIAEALEAAHEHGIIHRDLKPANIKLTSDGTVKVLDFGLAKAADVPAVGRDFSRVDLSMSPTITSPAMGTLGGVILGTAAYMSPEQAKGKPVDKRSDIWAFGCVVFEMLTGKRAFDGDDTSDALAAILRGEPAWHEIPSETPAALSTLLKRCVQKDRRHRIGDIAAAQFVLSDLASVRAVTPTAVDHVRPVSRERWAWAALFGIAVATAGYLALRPSTAAEPLRHLSVALPPGASVSYLALSPDGRRLAMTLSGLGFRRSQLWVRTFDAPDARILPNTEGARTPFWSPDGRTIGFFADGKLKTISATGGLARDLCDGAGLGAGGTWNNEGVILFGVSVGARRLRQVKATGGACTDVTAATEVFHAYPSFLPDGQHYLYFAGGQGAERGIYVASLADPNGRRVIADLSSAIFSPPTSRQDSGHLLFIRDGTLMAQPFNATTLETVGDVFSVARGASFSSSPSHIAASVSDDRLLAYVANRPEEAQLRWFDRTGKQLATVGAPSLQQGVVLSRNDNSVLLSRNFNGWRRDLLRDLETIFAERFAGNGAWSSDGQRVIHGAADGTLTVKNISDGKEELLPVGRTSPKYISDWSSDDRFLIYTDGDPKTQADIWILEDPLSRAGKPRATPFIVTAFNESQAQLSPDGHWIAYTSDESGQYAVYLASFPTPSTKLRISPADGREPRWSADGRELFFLGGVAGRFKVTTVPYDTRTATVSPALPTELFEIRTKYFVPLANIFQYSPASDGRRFLVSMLVSDAEATVNVITNWHRTRD
jgi:eukaryotic-like serine/threonine-protein kinase